MQRKFLIPFIKYAKRGDLIHCTPVIQLKNQGTSQVTVPMITPPPRPKAQFDLVIIFIVRFQEV